MGFSRSGRRVTSADVARAAGVSRTTVSYVVNGQADDMKIPPETRERVLAIAHELGYSQYGPGRTLKSGRSDVVLFVLNDLPVGHAINSMIDELQARLADRNLSLVLFRVSDRSSPLSRIWREIGPRAAIGLDSISDEDAAEMSAAGIGVHRLTIADGDGTGVLVEPQTQVGEIQVRHLASRGHRRLGYAYPDDPRVETFARERLRGVRMACEALGLPEVDVRIVRLEAEQAAEAMRPWFTAPEPTSAICAYNDTVALAVLAGLRRLGVTVPNQVSVVGVDNDPIGALVAPTLTTIDVGQTIVADELVRRLLVSLGDKSLPGRDHLDPYSIVVRDSAP
jgi:DNA-binding LacI/PurR family transcriptional regulator